MDKKIKIIKLKDRIEILKENLDIAIKLEKNEQEKKLDLIREMSISSQQFDFANIKYEDFPLYVFGSEFLNAEIERTQLNISRLAKDNYVIAESEIALSKKYLNDLNYNFNNINFNSDNLSFLIMILLIS